MTLEELVQIKNRYYRSPAWAATLPKEYIVVVEERIASEKAKMQCPDDDPILNAKIEKWIAEGRITFKGSIGNV